jgi:hypothetical protein
MVSPFMVNAAEKHGGPLAPIITTECNAATQQLALSDGDTTGLTDWKALTRLMCRRGPLSRSVDRYLLIVDRQGVTVQPRPPTAWQSLLSIKALPHGLLRS